jgi:hypothetical protein
VPTVVNLEPANAKAGGALDIQVYTAGPMDQPEKSLGKRFSILLRRVAKIEKWVGEVEGDLRRETREAREHASKEAETAYSRMAALLDASERDAASSPC